MSTRDPIEFVWILKSMERNLLFMPEAQTLLTVVQGTVLGMPAPKAACLRLKVGFRYKTSLKMCPLT
jgi:hypothetical protein